MKRLLTSPLLRPVSILLGLTLSLAYWELARQLPGALWWQSLFAPNLDDVSQAVVHFSWLPRLAVTLLAGAALGLAGTLMQQVLRNPLASPTTLGVASGAQLALMMVTLFAPSWLLLGREWIAMAGGSLAMALVFALAWRRQLNPVVIVFAGLVINLYLAAISMGLLLFFQEELKGLLVWGSGSLVQNSWSGVSYLLPRLLAAALLAAVLVRPLAVLELDDASARSLGVSLQHLAFCRTWLGGVCHRLRGERGGADRLYRVGSARHGAAARDPPAWPAAAVGSDPRRPAAGGDRSAAAEPEPLLASLDPHRRHDRPAGGAAAALADPAPWYQVGYAEGKRRPAGGSPSGTGSPYWPVAGRAAAGRGRLPAGWAGNDGLELAKLAPLAGPAGVAAAAHSGGGGGWRAAGAGGHPVAAGQQQPDGEPGAAGGERRHLYGGDCHGAAAACIAPAADAGRWPARCLRLPVAAGGGQSQARLPAGADPALRYRHHGVV